MVSRENKFKLAAFILLFISICFNFKVWIIDYYFLGIFHSKKEIVIQPTLITTMISIFFFGGYIIRNVNDIFNDIVKIIFCALDILFFSGFIAMFSNGKTNFLGFSSQSVLLLIVISMWIGLKSLLRYIILAFIASSVHFIGQLSDAMGFFGALYILFAFLSFCIQIYTNILPNTSNINDDFFGEVKKENDENQEYELRDN